MLFRLNRCSRTTPSYLGPEGGLWPTVASTHWDRRGYRKRPNTNCCPTFALSCPPTLALFPFALSAILLGNTPLGGSHGYRAGKKSCCLSGTSPICHYRGRAPAPQGAPCRFVPPFLEIWF